MSPVSQARQYRWKDSGKSPYAARFEKKKWEMHEKEIKSLHAKGRTKQQIIDILETQHGFQPTYGQMRRRLDRWFPKTTHSVVTPSRPSSPIKPPPGAPKPYPGGLGHQSPRTETRLTKDDEDMFKTYTSILDDGNETTEPYTRAGKYTSTDAKGASQRNEQHSQQKKRVPSGSLDTAPSDDHPAPVTPANPPQTEQAATCPSTTIAVDSDEDKQRTESGPLLQTRWSASPDSKDFEELSVQLCLTRARLRYHSHKDLDSGVPRTKKKTRQRMRYYCCACGEVAHCSSCEGCHHKKCSGCQEGTRS